LERKRRREKMRVGDEVGKGDGKGEE